MLKTNNRAAIIALIVFAIFVLVKINTLGALILIGIAYVVACKLFPYKEKNNKIKWEPEHTGRKNKRAKTNNAPDQKEDLSFSRTKNVNNFTSVIKGTSYSKYKSFHKIKHGTPVKFLAAPTKKYPNAIKIIKNGKQLGYVDKRISVHLFPIIKNGGSYDVKINSIWEDRTKYSGPRVTYHAKQK